MNINQADLFLIEAEILNMEILARILVITITNCEQRNQDRDVFLDKQILINRINNLIKGILCREGRLKYRNSRMRECKN